MEKGPSLPLLSVLCVARAWVRLDQRSVAVAPACGRRATTRLLEAADGAACIAQLEHVNATALPLVHGDERPLQHDVHFLVPGATYECEVRPVPAAGVARATRFCPPSRVSLPKLDCQLKWPSVQVACSPLLKR